MRFNELAVTSKYMNYKAFTYFFLYFLVIISLGLITYRMNVNRKLIRKTVHFATGITVLILSHHLEKSSLLVLLLIGTVFSFVTFFIRKFEFLHAASGSSLGTLFYPIGLSASFLLLYHLPIRYFQISVLFLAVSDTVANAGGYLRKWNPRFTILEEEKSLWGAIGFALTAYLILRLLLPGSGPAYLSYLLMGILVAINTELISFRGSDNLTVPLGIALFFYLTPEQTAPTALPAILIPIMALMAWALFRKNILTRYGSILAYLLGIYYFTILGYEWIIPPVFFFLSSVIFTRFNAFSNKKPAGADRRNVWQVLANISIALLCSAIYLRQGNEIYIYFYIALVAAVTADTWASEIGPVFNRKCFSLSDRKIKDAGISGGISISGSLASLAGAFSIAIASVPLLLGPINWKMVLILTLSGFLASFIDSLLGAFAEPHLEEMNYFRKRTPKSRNTVVQPNRNNNQPSSQQERLAPNDLVNLLASMTAPLFFVLLSKL